MRAGRLAPDGTVLTAAGEVRVTKIAIEPVWYLPGVAARFGISTTDLRRGLFEQTGGMFPELVTRPDLEVFLPPIGGMSVYIFGDPAQLGRAETRIACRVHDECNGSDVFGSDICTCRPYLAHGIEVCVATAQQGGVGVVVYNRKEGRALGEVTKFLVYNARKRQAGGDRAEAYFQRTECVAGVADMRFQELMPDVLHWLGITRIDRLVSMSNMKYAPIVASGIEVVERVPIPDGLIPADAAVSRWMPRRRPAITPRLSPDAVALKPAQGPRAARLSAMSDRRRLAWLRTPDAVRERCHALLALAEQDALPHFAFDPARLDDAADYVAAVIRQNYPDLAIPYHAAGGISQRAGSTAGARWPGGCAAATATEIARLRIDLCTVSVLLDAGAGAAWTVPRAGRPDRC